MRTGTRVLGSLHEEFHPEGKQSLVAALWPLIVDMAEWVDELYITNGGLQVPEENRKTVQYMYCRWRVSKCGQTSRQTIYMCVSFNISSIHSAQKYGYIRIWSHYEVDWI